MTRCGRRIWEAKKNPLGHASDGRCRKGVLFANYDGVCCSIILYFDEQMDLEMQGNDGLKR